MLTRLGRALHLLIGTVTLAALLAACGAQSPSAAPAPEPTAAPAETPEERVKGFFTTLSDAINDPEISGEERKAEWIEKLVAYAPPDQRDGARTELSSSLAAFTGLNVGELAGQPDLDVRMEMLFNITETRLVEENGDNATVEIVAGTISMKPVGADVEKLGEAAAMMTQELPISEFFGDTGDDNQIKLQRIDGVWYLMDALGSGV